MSSPGLELPQCQDKMGCIPPCVTLSQGLKGPRARYCIFWGVSSFLGESHFPSHVTVLFIWQQQELSLKFVFFSQEAAPAIVWEKHGGQKPPTGILLLLLWAL